MQSTPPPVQQPAKKTNVVLIVVIICAVGFCLIVPIMAALLFPVFSQAKLSAQKSATMSSAKQISLSLLMYAADHDDTLPPQLSTSLDLKSAVSLYDPSSSVDLMSNNPAGGEFVPNANAQGLNLARVLNPERGILVLDSMPWKNDGGRVVGFFDASAKYIKAFDETAMLEIELAPKE